MRIPRAPGRAHLPLLPSGPGGVGRDTATRGTSQKCTGSSPPPQNPPPRLPRNARTVPRVGIAMTSLDFGPFGITTGLTSSADSLDAARVAEDLGYPAIWLSGGPLPGLRTVADLIGATSTIKFVTGILSVDTYSAVDVTSAYAELEATAPG